MGFAGGTSLNANDSLRIQLAEPGVCWPIYTSVHQSKSPLFPLLSIFVQLNRHSQVMHTSPAPNIASPMSRHVWSPAVLHKDNTKASLGVLGVALGTTQQLTLKVGAREI
jgi:hypothetical protein